MPTKTAEPSATDGTSKRVHKLMSESAFKSVLTEVAKAEKRKDESTGDMGQIISEAAKSKGLHKGAFKQYRACLRMSPEKLEDFLTHFDHYRKLGKLDEVAGLQGQLPGAIAASGTPPGEVDVRPQFLKDKTDGRGAADTAKH